MAAFQPSDWLRPEWPAPERVQAVCSGRSGGSSSGVYASLNLGDHVGDDVACVARNRQHLLQQGFSTAMRTQFLQQVHGTAVCDLDQLAAPLSVAPMADAATSTRAAWACTVMVADCLPVLFCDTQGQRVAAAHAGWRGLHAGVLQAALAHFAPEAKVLAWLGPAIGPQAFEVGAEVRAAFVTRDAWSAAYFQPTGVAGQYWADLPAIARHILQSAGVAVYGNDSSSAWCSYSQPERWFSHRWASHQGHSTGRFACAIGLRPLEGDFKGD